MHYKLRDIDEKARRLYAEDIDKYDGKKSTNHKCDYSESVIRNSDREKC